MDLGQTMWKLKKSEDLASNYSKKKKKEERKGEGWGREEIGKKELFLEHWS